MTTVCQKREESFEQKCQTADEKCVCEICTCRTLLTP
jgi:hypothetical protein